MSNNSKNDTTQKMYQITEEQYKKLQALMATRSNQTIDEVFNTVVDRGLYDLKYRTERNRKQYAQYKEWKQSQQQ